MTAHMSAAKVQKQFSFELDIEYIDFRSRSCANLEMKEATAELGYRIAGHEGPRTLPTSLMSQEDFGRAMERISALIQRARTKEYGIEVVNLVGNCSLSLRLFSYSLDRIRLSALQLQRPRSVIEKMTFHLMLLSTIP